MATADELIESTLLGRQVDLGPLSRSLGRVVLRARRRRSLRLLKLLAVRHACAPVRDAAKQFTSRARSRKNASEIKI